MSTEIHFYVRSEEGIHDILNYRTDDFSTFLDPGIYDFKEYMMGREEALLEGNDPTDHYTRYDLAEKYISKKLFESVFEGKKIESSLIRGSELRETREDVLDAIRNQELDQIDADEFCDHRCVRMDDFSDRLLVEVEEI